jgi:hypothetical protein
VLGADRFHIEVALGAPEDPNKFLKLRRIAIDNLARMI